MRKASNQQFSNFREDKENIPHEDDDEDGPILYRDEDSMEEEGKTRRESMVSSESLVD